MRQREMGQFECFDTAGSRAVGRSTDAATGSWSAAVSDAPPLLVESPELSLPPRSPCNVLTCRSRSPHTSKRARQAAH